MLDCYTTKIMIINYHKNTQDPTNQLIEIITQSNKVTLEELEKCQEIINKFYDNAYKNNLKYNVIININNMRYSDFRHLTLKTLINIYNENKFNTEKYLNCLYINCNNLLRKTFINTFLYFYKIRTNVHVINVKE